jgi:protein-tyrosine phosphatase
VLRVLLVCTGNICRTPIAEGFLSDRSERLLDAALTVRSSGTWARPGSRPTEEAVQAAGERGIDISGHRAKPLTRGLSQWADLIVAMSEEHADEVLEQSPGASSKTFTLKELVGLLNGLPAPSDPPSREALLERIAAANRLRAGSDVSGLGDLDVADPLGLPVEGYRRAAWEIEELIDALVRGLTQADRPAAVGDRES